MDLPYVEYEVPSCDCAVIPQFDVEVGQVRDDYGSVNFVLARVVETAVPAHIVCIYLGPNGVVGYHQTVGDQHFLVVQGQGWVRGEGPERFPVQAGQAVFWYAGERHESGSDEGMTAVVIEAASLDPDRFMPELSLDESTG